MSTLSTPSGQLTLFVTNYCPYCTYAKQLLTRLKLPFEVVDVTGDDARRAALVERTGMRTVPQLFVGDRPVGGFTDLEALHKAGGFMPLVRAEGIAVPE